MTLPALTLILGGARSGKSARAEALIEAAGGGSYVATAQAFDEEMRTRIAAHRDRRGAIWRTFEVPLDLAGALTGPVLAAGRPVLVDCLTLWLGNLLMADDEPEPAIEALLAALDRIAVPVVMVSNEVGLGIVPDNPLARRFRDTAGRLHQRLAARADEVTLMVAGLPVTVKDGSVPTP